MLERLPDVTRLPGGYEAFGFARGEEMVGGVLFTNFIPFKDGGDIQIWGAGDTGWLSRRSLRVIFGYPFLQLGCNRVTAIVSRKNKRSRKMVEDIGFKLEGVHPGGFGPRRDSISYGLQKADCRWIKP